MKTSLKIAAVSQCFLLLGACSSLVLKPVSEADKINSDTYDGRWLVTGESTASKQRLPGNWVSTCNDRAGQELGAISVNDGQARASFDRKGTSPAFVNDQGKFRFEVPTDIVVSEDSRSDSSISRGETTILVYGSLETGQGKFTLGIAEFANAGCTSTVSFKRI